VSRYLGKGSPGQGPPPSHGGWPRKRNRKAPWDVTIANSGDALPPRPGEFGHSPRRLTGPSPPLAPLSTMGQGQHWERKSSFPEPSRPGHWDLNAAKAEIRWVFTETRQVLHAVWAAPCIVNAGYPRTVQTRVAPLNLEGPGARSSPKLPALGQAPLGRLESEEEASDNLVAHFDSAQSREGMGAGVLLVSPTGQLCKYAI
jgi:hypothetical protein